jgi:hypothetical protein
MAQQVLYALMGNFAIDTVVSLCDCVYKDMGPEKLKQHDTVIKIILPVAESYFNDVAMKIESREDQFINEKFDEMSEIRLLGPNHPIDNLQSIVLMFLHIIRNMEIKDLVGFDRKKTMEGIRSHLKKIVLAQAHLAKCLNGCDETHEHNKIEGPVFEFSIN